MYIDNTAIMQIIGCCFNNPQLTNDERFNITEDDFIEEFHKIVFGSIVNIHNLESDVTIDTIIDYLAVRPKYNAIFEINKGVEYLSRISQLANENTFNYYYHRMKKMTLLRAYHNVGIDVSDIYDDMNILDTDKKQEQEEWLDSHSLVEIADIIDTKISLIRTKYAENDIGNGYQAGDQINELIDNLKATPAVGIPMFGPLINTVTRGARLKKFYLRSAPSGCGKAIPNDTIIPTPNGYKMVKDIKVGDYLFGDDGKPTKVLARYPQSKPKQVYKVIFADGREAKCCEDHLWEYYYKSHREWVNRAESVKDILKRTENLKNGFKNSDNKGYRFKIKINQPLEYEEKSFSIDPYVLGLILGDGSFRYNDNQKAFYFSSADEELPENIAKRNNWNYIKNSDLNYNYSFKYKDNFYGHENVWVEEILKEYPELWNLKSNDKFIPQDYFYGSINQRYELLRGLLDTDGSIDIKGRVDFTSTSYQLILDVQQLCYSLGMFATITEDKRSEKYTNSCYNLHIQCKKEIKPLLFNLTRKKEIAENYAKSNKRTEHKEYNCIIDIIVTDEYTDMTCFTVDNNSHLFLMNDCIVTHNTRSMIADACNFGCDKIYYDAFSWVKNGISNPTLFITTEQEKSEIQTMMLAFLSNVNEEHILDGEYVDDEEERVREAAKILQNSPLWIEELPDFSLDDIESIIKKYIIEYDVSYIILDYIHSSIKILTEIGSKAGIKLREDNILFMLSTRLKDLCNKYGVFILSATQLSGDYRNSETPDSTLLRGAKSIGDKVDIGLIMLPPTDDDLVKLEPILSSGRFEIPNLKISVYKNRRGAYKSVYLWCYADLSTCRITPMFCTKWDHSLVSIEDIKIIVEEESAF